MKLNPDCIRDILLFCEERCTAVSEAEFSGDSALETGGRSYQSDELFYHLNQCRLNGYFTKAGADIVGNYTVQDLTPKAHEFLANIRSDSVWNDVKGIAVKTGSKSLAALTQIATAVVSEIIRATLRANGVIS